jgi:hypothetical protein
MRLSKLRLHLLRSWIEDGGESNRLVTTDPCCAVSGEL